MAKLKFRGNSSNQVLFLTPNHDYVRNYTNHIAWETSNRMNDGTPNSNYDSSIDSFKQFLINKGVKFSVAEKFYKNIKANVTRIIISKDQITIEE
jgi:hypothetical protein